MKRLAATVALAAVVAVAPAAHGADSGVIIDQIEAGPSSALSMIVTVTTSEASLVATDFAVVVDGVRVPADVFALVRDPMEVVVAVDTSGSMAGAALAEARTAAAEFVTTLPPTVDVAVVSFGTEAIVHTAMGAPRSEAVAALSGLAAAGETALYDAVVAATGLFTDAEVRKVLVLLSDGGDTASGAVLADAVAATRAAGVEVRPVALSSPESDPAALAALASRQGVIAATGVTELAAAYEAVARELTGRYRLAFRSTAAAMVEISVYVDTVEGIVADSRVVDLATGVVVGTAVPKAPPAGFGLEVPPPQIVVAAPEGLAAAWSLPAGIALVFAGLVLGLWLTTRVGGDADPPPFLPEETNQRDDRRWLGALAAGAKGLGDRVVGRRRASSFDLTLDRAGVALRPGEFVVVAATGVVVGVTLGMIVAGAVGAILFGAAAAAAPRTVLRILTDRRRHAFGDQLEGTLQTIAGSLRAGYGLVQAINTVAAESPSPTSEEFNRVVVENRLGRSIEQSMAAMARRLENEDLGWVVEAIEIQHEVGGNLAEVLDTVTATIRDRNQIRRQVKALSAEGRISAFILLALPFVIGAFIAMISPDYLSELTDSVPGRIMLGVAALLMLAGGAWIRRIIEVKF